MLNVVWMEREFDAYKLSRSMYPSVFNSFPVILTAIAKNRSFHVPQPTFLFPLETPLRLSRNVAWMERQFNACQTCRSMYLSISVVSELYDAKVRKSKNRYFYHIFVSHGDAPGAITLNVV